MVGFWYCPPLPQPRWNRPVLIRSLGRICFRSSEHSSTFLWSTHCRHPPPTCNHGATFNRHLTLLDFYFFFFKFYFFKFQFTGDSRSPPIFHHLPRFIRNPSGIQPGLQGIRHLGCDWPRAAGWALLNKYLHINSNSPSLPSPSPTSASFRMQIHANGCQGAPGAPKESRKHRLGRWRSFAYRHNLICISKRPDRQLSIVIHRIDYTATLGGIMLLLWGLSRRNLLGSG